MAFSRTLERISLVAVGVVVGAAGLAAIGSDDRASSPNAATVTAGLSAPALTDRLGGASSASEDPSSEDLSTSADGESSEAAATSVEDSADGASLSSATEASSDDSEASGDDDGDGTRVFDRSIDLSSGDAAGSGASVFADPATSPVRRSGVGSASAGAVSAIVVELAPATKIFGSKPTPPTTTVPPTTSTTVPVTTTTTAPTPPPANGRTVEGAEWRLLNGINGLRNRSGVNGISMNETARTEARRWSKFMAENNIFDHRPEITDGVVWTNAVGENVATGGNIKDIHDGLWNSEGHRANILSVNFTEVGIGVWYDASTGKFWVTEIFIG